MWDLIVSVPDHCLSFYFGSTYMSEVKMQRKWSMHFLVLNVLMPFKTEGNVPHQQTCLSLCQQKARISVALSLDNQSLIIGQHIW